MQNPHIGKNLHVHPANYVKARFDEDVMPWKGSCITSICDLFENLDGKGHGVKLETMNMVVGCQSSISVSFINTDSNHCSLT